MLPHRVLLGHLMHDHADWADFQLYLLDMLPEDMEIFF